MTLFRWVFPDGVPDTATFSRTSSATFVEAEFTALDPAFVRAHSLSESSINIRDARGGDTL